MKMQMVKTVENDEGFVLVATIFILVIITLAGVFAITNSNTELSIVRNTQLLTREFYEAEAGIIDALENSNLWMTNAFLIAGETSANATLSSTVTDTSGNPVANIEVRCIESSGTAIPSLSNEANDLPLQSHTAPPPSGSGYSAKYFQIRRYGITTTSTDGRTIVQGGAWKIFNKY